MDLVPRLTFLKKLQIDGERGDDFQLQLQVVHVGAVCTRTSRPSRCNDPGRPEGLAQELLCEAPIGIQIDGWPPLGWCRAPVMFSMTTDELCEAWMVTGEAHRDGRHVILEIRHAIGVRAKVGGEPSEGHLLWRSTHWGRRRRARKCHQPQDIPCCLDAAFVVVPCACKPNWGRRRQSHPAEICRAEKPLHAGLMVSIMRVKDVRGSSAGTWLCRWSDTAKRRTTSQLKGFMGAPG
jgi:hypothetical protein